jgi:dihydroorotate dehydrogenase (NAD+) catalytic subunit
MVKCVDKLERVESVAAIQVGFRDDEELPVAESILRAALESTKPIVVQLPHDRAAAFARLSEKVGAQVVVVSAPARGTMLKDGEWVTGRLYGVAQLPRALHLIREIKTQTSLPIIGAGGVHSQDEVTMMLEAGASAVQVDSMIWTASNKQLSVISKQ